MGVQDETGHENYIKNYSPISIINSLSKLFEFLVLDKLVPLNSNLFEKQHGFLKVQSKVTNLASLISYINCGLEDSAFLVT